MSGRAWRAGVTLGAALAVLLVAERAEAKTRTLAISGVACPAETELIDALRDVLVDTAIERVDGAADLTVVATDADVAVTAFDTTRRFSGTCAERARLVSAYLALALEPPAMPPPPAPVPTKAAPPAAHAPPARPRESADAKALEARITIGAGVLGTVGTAEHGGAAAPTFMVRGALGRGALHGIVGIGATLPASLATRGPNVALSRLSLDAGIRVVAPLGRLAIGGEVSALLARATVEAEGLSNPEPAASRAELGARVAAISDLRLGGLVSLTASLETQLLPGAATLALRREGTVGELPAVYLGGTLGLTFRAK